MQSKGDTVTFVLLSELSGDCRTVGTGSDSADTHDHGLTETVGILSDTVDKTCYLTAVGLSDRGSGAHQVLRTHNTPMVRNINVCVYTT